MPLVCQLFVIVVFSPHATPLASSGPSPDAELFLVPHREVIALLEYGAGVADLLSPAYLGHVERWPVTLLAGLLFVPEELCLISSSAQGFLMPLRRQDANRVRHC